MPISLFYHYADISDSNELAERLRAQGAFLKLAGRVRVSPEGVNGTCGGDSTSLTKFHEVIVEELESPQIDFKISEGSAQNFPKGWVVRHCAEMVTLGVSAKCASWKDAAPHIGPEQFQSEILCQSAIILDVRNRYEHAIGRFSGAILPSIRQFSDFPKFLEDNKELFRDRRVLMYCTGGVRCEKASAYIRKMDISTSVAQLSGGIVQFLATYPAGGGVWQGKNLVFDTRMSTSTTPPTTVGQCVICELSWDDYSSNVRCRRCRARVLLCENVACQRSFSTAHGALCSHCKTSKQ